jgi:hypothetical protein
MDAYFFIKHYTNSDDKWFGLDTSAVKIEKVPLVIRSAANVELKRLNPPKMKNGKCKKPIAVAKDLSPEEDPPLVRYT